MPRKPRLFIPDQAVHVVKRGHNRDPIVARKVDYQYFTDCLLSACREYGVALHAWVLMTNHFHLLLSPGSEDSLPRMMQWLGGHYARYFNKCYRRSGSLWEGRYKTSLIDSDNYLLKTYRYIELNPVRAGMVEHPRQYPWSSYRANAEGDFDFGVRLKSDTCRDLLTPHSIYLALAADDGRRYAVYQSLFLDELDRQTLMQISRGIEKGKEVGNPEFLLKVAKMRDRGQA
jgi:REP-associated tyrosine transposase